MKRLTKTTLFKTSVPRSETLLDRTTRAAREILDDETEKRQDKTERLRKARLAKEAGAPAETPVDKPAGARKKSRANAAE